MRNSRHLWAALILSVAGIQASIRAEPLSSAEPKTDRTLSPGTVAERLESHVTTLASPEFEGRGTSKGKDRAARYIVAEFEKLKLRPLFPDGGYFQSIPGPRDSRGQPLELGRNLGGWLPGSDPGLSDEFVILSAHYDHLGIRNGQTYPGADDNAGSVAMMLEVARRFAREGQRPKRSLVFLSCDLEERMLWGARWFVAHAPWPLEQVKLFITAEMIGRRLGDLPMDTLFVLGAEHGTGMKEAVKQSAGTGWLELAHMGVDIIGDRSDYGPFRARKIPFLFFSGGEHPDYHKPTDVADRLDYPRVAKAV